MPTPDASQYTQIKRLLVDQSGKKSLVSVKFRAPFFYGGYGFVQGIDTKFGPNALISNKFLNPPVPPVTGPGGSMRLTATTDNLTFTVTFTGIMTIIWGDMVVETFDSTTWSGNSITHTYSASSNYMINISLPVGAGDITAFSCSNTAVDTIVMLSMPSLNVLTFTGCTSLQTVNISGAPLLNGIDVIGTSISPKLNPTLPRGRILMNALQATVYPGNDPATYYETTFPPAWLFIIV